MSASFRRVAILGTGLIGGSFALALRKYSPDSVVNGWDKAHVLRHALDRGAINEGFSDLSLAVAGADLIYMALPVGHTIELLPDVAKLAPSEALVTDASSTKRSVCAAADESFSENGAYFLGGHPMAGKEISGIAAAASEFFRGSKYALIRKSAGESPSEFRDVLVTIFVALIGKSAEVPDWLDAESHHRAPTIYSHLSQFLS